MQTAISTERPLALLVNRFPKLSETFILEEVLGLERAGVPLRLYALREPTDAISHAAVSRVRAPVTLVPQWRAGQRFTIAMRHVRLFAGAPLRYAKAFAYAWRAGAEALRQLAQAGWLAAELREQGVTHLHTHFISMPADVAAWVSQLSGISFSISAHAKDIYLSPREALQRKLSAASFTVTCTEFNRRTLAGIAPHARVYRMYHGVDRAQFHPRPHVQTDAPTILSVGRLRAKKGLDMLIEACRILHARGERVRCEIIGYGEEQPRLQAQIDACRLAGFVRLAGKLAREQVIEAYARAAVYVQPSRITADGDRDGIPNVLLEAMAMGLPVVASRVSGIPELVVDGDNGLLVEPDDPIGLADAISRALHDPALCAVLSRRARDSVAAAFDNDRNLKLLCSLLASCGDTVHTGSDTHEAHTAPLGAE